MSEREQVIADITNELREHPEKIALVLEWIRENKQDCCTFILPPDTSGLQKCV